MRLPKFGFPKLKLPKIKFARTPLAFAVAFVVFSLVLSLVSPKLKIATVQSGPTPQWGPNGQAISDHSGEITGNDITQAQVVDAGVGDYISFFTTNANGSNYNYELKAQKFNAAGERQWGDNGMIIDSNDNAYAPNFESLPDGAGGAFVLWTVYSTGTSAVFAQRIMPDGTLHFPSPVALGTSGQCADGRINDITDENISLVSDGAGGFIAGYTTTASYQVQGSCAQRVDADGNPKWGDSAVFIGSGNGISGIASDGAGGALIATESGSFGDNNFTINHFDADGNSVSGCPQNILNDVWYVGPQSMLADGAGGAIAAAMIDIQTPSSSESAKAFHVDGSCAVDQAWPSDGATIATGNIRIYGATLSPSGAAYEYSDTSNSAPTTANLLALSDGSSVWGGEKTLGASGNYYNNFNKAPIVSGTDLMYLLANGKVRKLIGATGADDPAFGSGGISLAPEGMGAAAAPDGSGGLVAVSVDFYANAQNMASGGTLNWPSEDHLIDRQFITNIKTAVGPDSYQGSFLAAAPNGDKAVFWTDHYSNSLFKKSVARIQVYDANGQAVLPAGGSVFETFSADWGGIDLIAAVADASGYYLLAAGNGSDGQSTGAFVQKFDANGVPLWGPDGSAVPDPVTYFVPRPDFNDIVPDGAGGLYTLTESDDRTQIVVNRFAADGSLPWVSALPVGSNDGYARVKIVQDGAGGAYAEWQSVNGGVDQIFATRVSSAGTIYPAFAYPGLAVGPAGNSWSYGLVGDGAGNAIVAYSAYQEGVFGIYAQKIEADGTLPWGALGKPVFGAGESAGYNSNFAANAMAPDGLGGFVLAQNYYDSVAHKSYIGAERLDADGDQMWGNGVQTNLTAALSGGEDTVPVVSTAGFGPSGMIKIGDSFMTYSGITANSFTGCVGVPAATSAAQVFQQHPVNLLQNYYGEISVIGNNGGAAFAYLNDPTNNAAVYAEFLDASGNVAYGGRIRLNAGAGVTDPYSPLIAVSNNTFLAAWNPYVDPGPCTSFCPSETLSGQYFVLPPPVPPYRWRNDDGTESSATFMKPENVPLTSLNRNTPMRLRMTAGNDGTQSELLSTASSALPQSVVNINFAVVDTAHGYAYFAGNSAGVYRNTISKVALGTALVPPRYISSIYLNDEDGALISGGIDPANGYAYFGTVASPGRVVKIALGSGDDPPRYVGSLTLQSGEDDLGAGVVDATHGYAYFTNSYENNAMVVKVALGSGDALPTRVGAMPFNGVGNFFHTAVIDPAGGYAYFGSQDYPSSVVVKVALGSGDALPSVAGAVTLNSGEHNITTSVIDSANGYAYFGTLNQVVKVALGAGSDSPTEIGAVTLDTGDSGLGSAVIDSAGGNAYFSTIAGADPASTVFKVALGAGSDPPTFVGSVTLNAGSNCCDGERGSWWDAVIDPANGYAYFPTPQAPAEIVRVALGAPADPPTRVDALALKVVDSSETNLTSGAIDAVHGYAYLTTISYNVDGADWSRILTKIRLGAGNDPPAVVGSIVLDTDTHQSNVEAVPDAIVVDPVHEYAYIGSGNTSPAITSPVKVVKVALGAGDDSPTVLGVLDLGPGLGGIKSAVIDPGNNYAYFGVLHSPFEQVIKVALGTNDDLPTIVGAADFTGGESDPTSAVIDPAAGYAYFGTYEHPGKVVKIALNGDAPPNYLGSVTLQGNEGAEGEFTSATIDPAAGYAYFGSYTYPGTVVKIALGSGDALPTRVGGAALLASECSGTGAASIDPVNGFAYFGSCNGPATVMKIALGSGEALPRRVGAAVLSANEGLAGVGIDPANGFAYFATSTTIEKISIAPKAQFRLEYGVRASSCSEISSWTQVPTTASTESFQMYDSPNLTDGEPTTDVPNGLTDTNAVFVPGEAKDTSSQTSFISLGEKEFTELEYSIQPTVNASLDANYCFRVTDAGTPTPLAEAVYPQINLTHAPSSGSGPASPSINPIAGNNNANQPQGGGGNGNNNANGNANANSNSNANTNSNSNAPSGSPVEPGTTDAIYHFTNPGNIDSFNLYEAPPGSSLRLIASNPDPTATSITETGLTPNTAYSNRVVTAVSGGTESAPSPAFPTFSTLLNNFDSIAASYDETAKTVSFTATGSLPNLTAGQSGVDFAVKDASGTVLFDSGFVQTPSPGSLASANLEPGESYIVTVTPRNQDGVLSPTQDFSVAIPAGTATEAKITLTKSAEKTDLPVSVNTRTNETVLRTKEIKYTITASNTGTGIAKTFVMTDPLPQGIDFKTGSINVVKDLNDPDDVVQSSYDPATRTITASLDELEPGESFTITFVATPASGTTSTTVKNKASASWSE